MSENKKLKQYLNSRRQFLKKAGLLSGAGLMVPAGLAASSDHRSAATAHAGNGNGYASSHAGNMVRIRGRVSSGNSGIQGIAVTDGLRITETDSDGAYELVSDGRRPFVYLSIPSGYRIPTNPTGTARFYHRIEPDTNGEMTASFELEPDPASREHHRFLLMADPQTENEYEVERFHSETVPDIEKLIRESGDNVPLFGIGCGDLMYDNLELFPEYEKGVKKMGIPFFQAIGNHDILFDVRSTEASYEVFKEYFGPAYYSFSIGEVHYVLLNNIFWYGAGYVGYLDKDQLDWLEADLARVEPGKTVIVAMHIPAESMQYRRFDNDSPSPRLSVANRHELYRILEPFNAHILSAHTHESEHVFEGGVHEHIHGTVCGAWWTGPICFDGTPNGYGVYEVRGGELRWHYKATGYDNDHQVKVYERGADPEAPGEILANVWDWDPEWKVYWYENGTRRGQMARRRGYDPLAVELFDGPDKPERRTWINAVPSDHIFYAPVSENGRDIVVEAFNRHGNTFSARLK